jgi:Rrf2 family protein
MGCHYAVRGLVCLAERTHPEEPVLLRDIAGDTGAPEAFLSKIFQNLRAAGIVRSHRGTARGYGLARDPKEISLYDVICATAGPATLHTTEMMADAMTGSFAKVWRGVEELIAEELKAKSISDLASGLLEGAPEGEA